MLLCHRYKESSNALGSAYIVVFLSFVKEPTIPEGTVRPIWPDEAAALKTAKASRILRTSKDSCSL